MSLIPGDDGNDGNDGDDDDSIAAAARLTISDGNKENKDEEKDGNIDEENAHRKSDASERRSAYLFQWQTGNSERNKEKRNGKDFENATVGPRISAADQERPESVSLSGAADSSPSTGLNHGAGAL